MKSKKSKPFVDDGRTIAPMDIPGMRGYDAPHKRAQPAEGDGENADKPIEKLVLTAGEKRAMRRAAWVLGLQVALVGGALMAALYLLVMLWIR